MSRLSCCSSSTMTSWMFCVIGGSHALEDGPELEIVTVAGGKGDAIEVGHLAEPCGDSLVRRRGRAPFSAAVSKSARPRPRASPMKCGYSAATLPESVTAQYRPDSSAEAAARSSSQPLGPVPVEALDAGPCSRHLQ